MARFRVRLFRSVTHSEYADVTVSADDEQAAGWRAYEAAGDDGYKLARRRWHSYDNATPGPVSIDEVTPLPRRTERHHQQEGDEA